MRHSLSLVVSFIALAACGDNKDAPDAQRRGDAPPIDAFENHPRAVAVAGDFGSPGTGSISKLEVRELMMNQNLVGGAVLGDPVLRQYGDQLYIVNRFGANSITILHRGSFGFIDQISTGANTNPQDVAVVGDKLFVPASGTAGVLVIKRGAPPTIETIDLSFLDTQGMDDGLPDCVSAMAIGTKVFVVCGMLDNFSATEPGKVVAIDSTNNQVLGMAVLPYRNPYGFLTRTPIGSTYNGDLVIATVPSFSNYATGCLARISTGDTLTASCGLTNMELGGFVNKTDVTPDGELMWIAVGTYDSSFGNPTGKLRGFDLESGMLWNGAVSDPNYLIVDVAGCPGGQVVAMDQTFGAAGLRVWKDLAERTTAPIAIGLPPTVNALVCYEP